MNPHTEESTHISRRAFSSAASVAALQAMGLGIAAPKAAAAPSVPPGAAQTRFNRLMFVDDFDSWNTFDRQRTGSAGYNWYLDRPFGHAPVPASDLMLRDSVLTINQTHETMNLGISTVNRWSKNGRRFRFGYFESRIRFDRRHSFTSAGFPAFWMISVDHFLGYEPWRWSELDVFEAWHPPGQDCFDWVIGTIHDWAGGQDRANYDNHVHYEPGVNFAQWHTYGMRWIPGMVTWYFDDVEVIKQEYSTDRSPVPNHLNKLGAGVFSAADQESNGQAMILGSGAGYPMEIDWVRVWGM